MEKLIESGVGLNHVNDCITDNQKWTIKHIEKNLHITFDGDTKDEATEFISEYIQKSYDEEKRRDGLLPPIGWKGWGELEMPKFFPNQLVYVCEKIETRQEYKVWKSDHMGSYPETNYRYGFDYVIKEKRFSLTLWEKYKSRIFETYEECKKCRDSLKKEMDEKGSKCNSKKIYQ